MLPPSGFTELPEGEAKTALDEVRQRHWQQMVARQEKRLQQKLKDNR